MARSRPDARWNAGPAAIMAALVVVALAVADAASGAVLVSLLIVGPLLCGLTASPPVTRAVGALAVGLALAAFAWNDNLSSWSYWVPLSVVALGAAFAWPMATYRLRTRRDGLRMQVLADVAQRAHGGMGVRATAQAIADAVVPSLVDLCLIDTVDADGRVQRVAVALDADPAVVDAVRARPPSPAASPGSAAHALVPATTQHLPDVDAAVRRGLAHDDEDLRLLERLSVESAVLVPLVARDRPIGVLTLGTRAPRARLDAGAARYAETLAGRVALAVDNAGLSAELGSAERRLHAILGTVDAAISVRDAEGRMVFTNQAAADLLGLPDPGAVSASSPAELMARFDVFTEEGDPVDLEDLPGTRLLRGERDPAPIVVRNVVRATGEERWLLYKATAVTDEDGRLLMAVNLFEDITQTKRGELGQRLLADAARRAAEAPDLAATAQALADAAVPGLADWAGVDLVEPSGRIRTVAIAHCDPDHVRLGWRLRTRWPVDPDADRGIPAVIRGGDAELVEEITDAMLQEGAEDAEHLAALRAAGLTSTMVVPVVAGSDVLGAMSLVSSTSRRFDRRDLRLACDLGRQAGIAIRNAQLGEERAHIAHTLQAGLLPDTLPALPGWDVSTVYRAAGELNEVGGDFYDVVRFDGGWAAVIGDVVGKGAAAAAVTALVRHTLAVMLESTADPAAALGVLNRRLRERGGAELSLCTVAVLSVTDDDVATVHVAGHPLPLLRRGATTRAVGASSPLLGVLDDVEVTPTTIDVRPGDRWLLYTDGVLDALGETDRFGEGRLLQALDGLDAPSAQELARHLVAAIDAFLSGEQTDDIAIVSLTREAVPAGRPLPAGAADA